VHGTGPRPDEARGRSRQDKKRRTRESLLEEDGICAVGEVAAPNDILVNRQTPTQTKEVIPGVGPSDPQLPDSFYKPSALAWKGPPGQNVVVDKVLVTTNEEGHMVVKARPSVPPACCQGLLRAPACFPACKVVASWCGLRY